MQKKTFVQNGNEMRLRLRPWLGRSLGFKTPNLISPSPSVVGLNEIEPARLSFHLTNVGTLPALNVQTYFWLNVLTEKNNKFEKLGEPFSLSPNEIFQSRVYLSEEQYSAAVSNDKFLYYGYRVEFTDINKGAMSYEMVGIIDRGVDRFISTNIT